MRNELVFISHATRDDAFVQELRLALEGLHIPVWVDSRNLRSSNTLAPEIAQAIEQACQVLVVLSPNTVNSPWVRRETRQALEVEKRRQAEGYRVIPLLLPGVETSTGRRLAAGVARSTHPSWPWSWRAGWCARAASA